MRPGAIDSTIRAAMVATFVGLGVSACNDSPTGTNQPVARLIPSWTLPGPFAERVNVDTAILLFYDAPISDAQLQNTRATLNGADVTLDRLGT